jgi:CRISPR-associated exonuclease Cas4
MLPILLLLLALLLWLLARRTQRASGLPIGRVVYTDTGGWGRLERPLFSSDLQLTGKPDYLVQDRGAYIPVEVKSGRAPADGPYPAHIYQLAAYCALVAEAYGRPPTHGLIKYADKVFAVDYTSTLEAELLDLLDSLRADAEADDVARSHASAARCRACGFRDVCDESLAV